MDGRLRPVPVPWQLSPSMGGLTLTAGEEQETVVTALARCLPDDHLAEIRVEFEGSGWALVAPHDGRDPLPADRYDWSGVPGAQQPGEAPADWFARQDALAAGGTHPLPGLYEVEASAWVRAVGARGLRHFVFAGHDRRVD
ncbi:MAG: hypothetical protein KC549_08255, partial [Myxococcales bacterium]|nr:hypothetical protein [Myxococcales bacterium]